MWYVLWRGWTHRLRTTVNWLVQFNWWMCFTDLFFGIEIINMRVLCSLNKLSVGNVWWKATVEKRFSGDLVKEKSPCKEREKGRVLEGPTGSDKTVRSLKGESRGVSKGTEPNKSSSHTTPHWHVSTQKLHLKGTLDCMGEHTRCPTIKRTLSSHKSICFL